MSCQCLASQPYETSSFNLAVALSAQAVHSLSDVWQRHGAESSERCRNEKNW